MDGHGKVKLSKPFPERSQHNIGLGCENRKQWAVCSMSLASLAFSHHELRVFSITDKSTSSRKTRVSLQFPTNKHFAWTAFMMQLQSLSGHGVSRLYGLLGRLLRTKSTTVAISPPFRNISNCFFHFASITLVTPPRFPGSCNLSALSHSNTVHLL